MATRNPEEKRRRLIAAGLEEFSERGLSGARLDRIARRAGCSAGLLYSYFASKEALFDAVYADLIDQIVEQVPITPDDLPGYAARLWSARAEHPVESRFIVWHELERGAEASVPELDAAEARKVAAIAAAQESGAVDATLGAEELLAAVLAVVHGYRGPAAEAPDAVRRAVARIVDPLETHARR
jgi:AcrR family transcriptional regulator